MTYLFIDNQQFIFIDPFEKGNFNVPEDLVERYTLALLEWETVQDELAEIFKG